MKYGKYKNLFFSEYDGEGGGGTITEQVPEGDVTEAKPQTAPAFDPKEFASTFSKTFAQEFKEVNKKEAQPLSPEEAKKLLKVWEPDDAYLEKFGNIATQKEAFAELRDRLFEQFDTVQQARMWQLQQAFQQQFEPVRQMLTQREEAERVSRFEAAYPVLKNESLVDLRNAVGQKLASLKAFEGKSEKECFDLVAQGMEGVLKTSNPNFSLGTTPSKPARSAGSITPTSHGSGGGGSGGNVEEGSGGAKLPRAASLFSKVRQ